MQKLLLELGAPLVFAFVLLAIAKFVRGILDRNKPPTENEAAESETELGGDLEEEDADPHGT